MNKGLSGLLALRAGKDVFFQNVQTVCGATLPTLPTQPTLPTVPTQPTLPTLPTQPTQPSTPWIAAVLSLEVKRPECEADYSHPCRE